MTSYNIAMLSSVFYPSIGGIQTHTLHLSQKLKARGVGVLVITRHYPGLARYEEVDGVPVYRVGWGGSNKAVAAVSYILGALQVLFAQRQHYAVLHCHQMISPMTIGLLARLLLRKPLVVNPHRSGPIGDVGILLRRRPLTGRLRLAAARRWSDAFITISPDIYDELRDNGLDKDKLWQIRNGVDVQHFRPASPAERTDLRQRLGLPQRPTGVFTGRLVHEKGIDVLLAAWQTVVQRVPDAYLVIVGEGEMRPAFEAQAHERGIQAHVHFAGGSDDVAPYLRAADAFVLPSRAEGLPVSLLEAMACQLPCVATNIGGTMQVLSDNVNGRLVPVEAVPALAEALVDALTTTVAPQWAAAARQHVVEHYSLDVVADRYIHMYSALLRQPSAPAYSTPGN